MLDMSLLLSKQEILLLLVDTTLVYMCEFPTIEVD